MKGTGRRSPLLGLPRDRPIPPGRRHGGAPRHAEPLRSCFLAGHRVTSAGARERSASVVTTRLLSHSSWLQRAAPKPGTKERDESVNAGPLSSVVLSDVWISPMRSRVQEPEGAAPRTGGVKRRGGCPRAGFQRECRNAGRPGDDRRLLRHDPYQRLGPAPLHVEHRPQRREHLHRVVRPDVATADRSTRFHPNRWSGRKRNPWRHDPAQWHLPGRLPGHLQRVSPLHLRGRLARESHRPRCCWLFRGDRGDQLDTVDDNSNDGPTPDDGPNLSERFDHPNDTLVGGHPDCDDPTNIRPGRTAFGWYLFATCSHWSRAVLVVDPCDRPRVAGAGQHLVAVCRSAQSGTSPQDSLTSTRGA